MLNLVKKPPIRRSPCSRPRRDLPRILLDLRWIWCSHDWHSRSGLLVDLARLLDRWWWWSCREAREVGAPTPFPAPHGWPGAAEPRRLLGGPVRPRLRRRCRGCGHGAVAPVRRAPAPGLADGILRSTLPSRSNAGTNRASSWSIVDRYSLCWRARSDLFALSYNCSTIQNDTKISLV